MSDGESIDVGGTIGTGFTAADGTCAEKCVCDALDTGLALIVDVLTAIDDTLAQDQQKSCDVISQCQSDIQALIDDALAGPLADLQAAQLDIAYLVEQASVDAMQIADLNTLLYEDYLGESANVPYIPPQPPRRQFYGWCDFAGGETLVTDSQVPPGPTFTQVAYGDEEDVVLAEATDTCKTYTTTSPYAQAPAQPTQVGNIGLLCDITSYQSFDGLAQLIGQGGQAFEVAGLSEAWGSIAALGIKGLNLGSIGQITAGVYTASYKIPPLVAHEFLPKIAGALGCNNPEWIAGLEVIAALGMASKFIGLDFKEFEQPIVYALNAACPRKFAEPKDALDAYLANFMEYKTAATHYAIAGFCPTVIDQSIGEAKSKREPEQLVMMRHRGIIDSEEYASAFRTLGYVDPDWPEQIFRTSEHLPDLGTVTRILQSGATEEQISSTLGLDEHTDQLQEGNLREWIKGNGIADETAKLFWRAHWQTPGVSTLIEFFHRLRDDDTYNANGELEKDIDNALDTLGFPTYWRKRLMAVALSPLLKRDIRIAYTSGALTDDNLLKALRTTGHTDDAVDTIARELKPARRQALLTHVALRNWTRQQYDAGRVTAELAADGFDDDTIRQALEDTEFELASSSWAESFIRGAINRADLIDALTTHGVTPTGAEKIADKLAYRIIDHQAIRDYVAGTVDRDSARMRMADIGMSTSTVATLLDNADRVVSNSLAASCERGVRSQYVTGGLDRGEAIDMLSGFGLTGQRSVDLVDSYDCQRKADGREVGVEKLCHWLYIGTIDQTDFYNRLLRIGYSEANAALLLADCVNANTLKAVKQQQQLAKELQRTVEQEKRAIDKVNATNQRRADRLAKVRSEQAKLRALRQKQYVSAAEKVYKATTADLATALSVVRDAIASVKSSYGLTEDESLRLAILAADEMKGQEVAAYKPLLEQLAAVAASAEPTPVLADVGQPPSSNGDTHPS